MYDAAGLNLILSFQQFDTAGTEVSDEAECPEGFAECMYIKPHSFSFLEIIEIKFSFLVTRSCLELSLFVFILGHHQDPFLVNADQCAVYWKCSLHCSVGGSCMFVFGAFRFLHSQMACSWRFWNCPSNSCWSRGNPCIFCLITPLNLRENFLFKFCFVSNSNIYESLNRE